MALVLLEQLFCKCACIFYGFSLRWQQFQSQDDWKAFTYKIWGFAWWNIDIVFGFAVTPCVYLNCREAEVQVSEKRILSHNSYLDYWFSLETIISLSDSRDTSLCDKVLFRTCTSALRDSWDKHTVLPQTKNETLYMLHIIRKIKFVNL